MRHAYLKVNGLKRLAAGTVDKLRSEGANGVVNSVAGRVKPHLFLEETHVWYRLLVRENRTRIELSPEFHIKKAGIEDLDIFSTLPAMLTVEQAEQRLLDGHELWLAYQGDRGVFACWILHERFRVIAAPDGYVTATNELVCLEDSVASPAFRGKNVAGAVVSIVADYVQQTEARTIVTKIEEDNAPSRRFVSKIGFEEFAVVTYRRRLLKRTTAVRAGLDEASVWLMGQLTR